MTSSRLLLTACSVTILAGCSAFPLGQPVETQPAVEIRSGEPVIVGAHEAARMEMANSGTFKRGGTTEQTQLAQPIITSEVNIAQRDIDDLITTLERAEQDAPPITVHSSSLENENAPTDLWERIRNGFAMPELNTKLVAKKEAQYLARPAYMQRMFERGGRYLYHIVEEIERRGMPTEIALLPFVESAMNPVAMSHAKASGLWQFIPSTGRAYDLKQNWWVDNRRDVVESTRAALDYLQMLHQMHKGDWYLALASYNWGEGSVNRAIRLNKTRGRPTDYLSLRMPLETRHYVPKLLALKNIIRNAGSLNVTLPELPNEPYFVVLEKTRPIDLELAASFAGMTVKDFLDLNPAHNRPVISASRNKMIKLPTENLDRFLAAMEDHQAEGKPFVSWRPYTLKAGETVTSVAKRTGKTTAELLKANGLSARQQIIAGTRILVPSNKATDAHIAEFNGPKVVEVVVRPAAYHRVRSRDNLTRIARRWGVSKKRLRSWNQLKSDRVYRGQKLLVRQPTNQTVVTTALGERKIIARGITKTVAYQPGRMHKVSAGQNLGLIARQYGVSIGELRAWNGLSGSHIRSGQLLQVKPAANVMTSDGSTRTQLPTTRTSKTDRYIVRAGDNLGKIARRHNVGLSDLKAWNGLTDSKIRSGQKLLVSAPTQANTSVKNEKKVVQSSTAKPAGSAGSVTPENHRVGKGDTLIGIARRYNISVASLRTANGLKDSKIRIGQKLQLGAIPPAPQVTRHRVRQGDTLIGIARQYGVSVEELRSWNTIKGDNIRLGQQLTIKTVESAGGPAPSNRNKS
ncbi:MAG: LysM peptidoglycan-binding domain-containing protein [Burkholderiaceae bacterium]